MIGKDTYIIVSGRRFKITGYNGSKILHEGGFFNINDKCSWKLDLPILYKGGFNWQIMCYGRQVIKIKQDTNSGDIERVPVELHMPLAEDFVTQLIKMHLFQRHIGKWSRSTVDAPAKEELKPMAMGSYRPTIFERNKLILAAPMVTGTHAIYDREANRFYTYKGSHLRATMKGPLRGYRFVEGIFQRGTFWVHNVSSPGTYVERMAKVYTMTDGKGVVAVPLVPVENIDHLMKFRKHVMKEEDTQGIMCFAASHTYQFGITSRKAVLLRHNRKLQED